MLYIYPRDTFFEGIVMSTASADFFTGSAVMRPGAQGTGGAGTSFIWYNTSNALTSNNVYSTASATASPISNYTGYTNYLTVNDFNAYIPSSATINGITVSVERKNTFNGIADSLSVSTDAVFLMYDVAGTATTIGSKKSSATTWTSTDVVETFGSSSDLWGRSWTADEVMNTNFGVALSAYLNYTYSVEGSGPGSSTAVDAITVTIDYTDTAPTRRRGIFTSRATLRTI
jgi:hypothetical protein